MFSVSASSAALLRAREPRGGSFIMQSNSCARAHIHRGTDRQTQTGRVPPCTKRGGEGRSERGHLLFKIIVVIGLLRGRV